MRASSQAAQLMPEARFELEWVRRRSARSPALPRTCAGVPASLLAHPPVPARSCAHAGVVARGRSPVVRSLARAHQVAVALISGLTCTPTFLPPHRSPKQESEGSGSEQATCRRRCGGTFEGTLQGVSVRKGSSRLGCGDRARGVEQGADPSVPSRNASARRDTVPRSGPTAVRILTRTGVEGFLGDDRCNLADGSSRRASAATHRCVSRSSRLARGPPISAYWTGGGSRPGGTTK